MRRNVKTLRNVKNKIKQGDTMAEYAAEYYRIKKAEQRAARRGFDLKKARALLARLEQLKVDRESAIWAVMDAASRGAFGALR